MSYTCLAVDDEPLALDVVETYIADITWLELAGRCGTSLEALDALRGRDIDILFLDIQLPDLSGFDLLKTLRNPPLVIFTTAYENYAAHSYTVDAIDYVVKPFSFERFLRAAQKAADALSASNGRNISSHFFIHTTEGDVRINVHDIQLVKGMDDYAVIKTPSREFVVRESLREIEQRIARHGYLRVHKSWIVAINQIVVIDRNILRIGRDIVPIGKTYREAVRRIIEERRLG